ncbi:MAG TPA: peptidylprolyl isomerase [Noviherbaspirillum sp.]
MNLFGGSSSRVAVYAVALALLGVGTPSHAADESTPARATVRGDTVLVTVNGQPVRRALFDGMLKARTEQVNPYDEPDDPVASAPRTAPPVDRKAVFDDLISMEVLAQKAVERGIHLRPEVAAEAELQYKTLLQQELVRDIIAGIDIAPAEILARYNAQQPERSYKVSHVLLKTEQEAQAVIRELGRGAKFAQIARKRTLDTHTRKDGLLGWMMASQLEESFVAALESMKPGAYSRAPVQTSYGWHVVQLHGVRLLDKPPFATARTWLRQEILHEKVSERLRQIRLEAKVEVPQSAGASGNDRSAR